MSDEKVNGWVCAECMTINGYERRYCQAEGCKGSIKIKQIGGSTMKEDQVNHPSHYNKGKIEVIEFLEDQKLNFHRANAVKYIARAGHKGVDEFSTDDKTLQKQIEDLKKAVWYLQRDIHLLECKRTGAEPLRPNDMNKDKK